MATKLPDHHTAKCYDCPARCDAANAQAWAHNHADRHGHNVALELGWEVRP